MINWSDSQTFWLNATNLALGVMTLVVLAAVAFGVLREVRAWLHARIEAQLAGDPHALTVRDLGVTMADGGERADGTKQS